MRDDYVEVDYLRVIAIILIVIWHCFFCTMYVWGIVEPQYEMKPFVLIAKFAIVDATMPLFTFVSGYLFTALYEEQGKYRGLLSFLKTKVNRLVIPFFVFSILIIATSYKMDFNSLIWGEGCHMWYCAMLFWCFVIDWFVKRVNKRVLNWTLFILSAALVFAYPNFWFLPFQLPLGIDNSLYYYSYFAFGERIFMYRCKLKEFKTSLVWAGYVMMFIVSCIGLPFISKMCSFFQAYFFSYALWITVINLIDKDVLRNGTKIKKLCKYSFGIYVFHHWLAWDIVWFPPVSEMLRNHYILFPLLLTIIVFISSYLLSVLSFKVKLGRYLLS